MESVGPPLPAGGTTGSLVRLVLLAFAAADVGLGDRHRQLPHAEDVGRSLRDTDATAGIQHVEHMRALQAVIQRRQHEVRIQQHQRERVVSIEELPVKCRKLAGWLFYLPEDVLRLLDFLLLPDRAVLHAGRPLEIEDVVHALNQHGDALEPVGDLRGNRRQHLATRLLKVRELRDLLPVQHDLPADPPRPERRRLPVILFKPDVVGGTVDAARREAVEKELLRTVRRRLQNDLKLVVLE